MTAAAHIDRDQKGESGHLNSFPTPRTPRGGGGEEVGVRNSTPSNINRRRLAAMIDPATYSGRVAHWKLWNHPTTRPYVGAPPCVTCGRDATQTFPDGSPCFRHYHSVAEREAARP